MTKQIMLDTYGMEIRQLRYVVAVAEELHFGRAAARLHISQAPLSTQIQRVERELGHRLFDRTTRRTRLTPAGAEFYRRAVEILAQLDRAAADLDMVAAGQRGRITVGFASSASYSVLPAATRQLREAAPGLDLVLVPLTSAEQAELLQSDELDLGVVRGKAELFDLVLEPLLIEQIVACVPADHHLAARDQVTGEDLSVEPMIYFPATAMPGYLAEIRPIFKGYDFPPVRHRVVHQETALGFVAAGVGFTLLPQSVSGFLPADVAVIPVASAPTTCMWIAHPRGGLGPGAKRFREVLLSAAVGGHGSATEMML